MSIIQWRVIHAVILSIRQTFYIQFTQYSEQSNIFWQFTQHLNIIFSLSYSTLLHYNYKLSSYMQSLSNKETEKLCFTWIGSHLTMKTQAQRQQLQKQLGYSIIECANDQQFKKVLKDNQNCQHIVISHQKYDAAIECLSQQFKLFIVLYYPANQQFDFSNGTGANFSYIKDFERVKSVCFKLVQSNKRQPKPWPNFVAINFDFTGANFLEDQQISDQSFKPFTCFGYWLLEKSKLEQLIKFAGAFIQNIEDFECTPQRDPRYQNTEIQILITAPNQYKQSEQSKMVYIKKWNIFKVLETKKFVKKSQIRYKVKLQAVDFINNPHFKEDSMDEESRFLKYLYNLHLSKMNNTKLKQFQIKNSIDSLKIKAKKFTYNEEIENAVGMYEELAIMLLSYYGQIHPQYATNLFYLACSYEKIKKMRQAQQAYLECLKIYKIIYGEMHLIFCPFVNDIAFFLEKVGDFNTANKIYKDSIRFYVANYDKRHPNIAYCFYRIGCICQRVGNIPKAILYYTQAATDHYEKYLTEFVDDYVNVMKYLAQIYLKRGSTEKGQKYLQSAILSIQGKYGKKHSKYAQMVSNLAMSYLSKGNSKKALKILAQTLKIKKQLNQLQDAVTAGIHNNLGIIYQQLGDVEKAKENYELAIKKYDKLYGNQKYKDEEILKIIGNTYRNNREFQKSASKYQKYIEILKQQGRTTEQLYAQGLNCLGKVYSKMGKYTHSVSCYEESLNVYQSFYGKTSLQYADVNANLAETFSFQGKFYDAITIMKQTVKTIRIIYGDFHNQYIDALNKFGCIYEKAQQYDRAYAAFEEAGRLCSIIYSQKSFQFRGAQYNVAVCLRHRNQIEKSKSLYLWSMLYRYELTGEEEKKFRKVMNQIRGYSDNRVKLKQNLHIFQSSLQKSLRSDGPAHKQFASNLRSYGSTMRKLENLELSMKLLQEARHIYKKLQIDMDYARCLYEIAAVYVLQYEYQQAFELLKKALKIFGKKGNEYSGWYADDNQNLYDIVQKLLFLERMQISPERQRQNMRKISIYF